MGQRRGCLLTGCAVSSASLQLGLNPGGPTSYSFAEGSQKSHSSPDRAHGSFPTGPWPACILIFSPSVFFPLSQEAPLQEHLSPVCLSVCLSYSPVSRPGPLSAELFGYPALPSSPTKSPLPDTWWGHREEMQAKNPQRRCTGLVHGKNCSNGRRTEKS